MFWSCFKIIPFKNIDFVFKETDKKLEKRFENDKYQKLKNIFKFTKDTKFLENNRFKLKEEGMFVFTTKDVLANLPKLLKNKQLSSKKVAWGKYTSTFS